MQTAKLKTNSEKELLIKEFLSSGKQKITWCEEKEIPYPTFYKWIKRHELNSETAQTKFIALPKSSSIKELEQKESIQVISYIMVEVNDCKINISRDSDLNLLTNVIKAVKLANV